MVFTQNKVFTIKIKCRPDAVRVERENLAEWARVGTLEVGGMWLSGRTRRQASRRQTRGLAGKGDRGGNLSVRADHHERRGMIPRGVRSTVEARKNMSAGPPWGKLEIAFSNRTVHGDERRSVESRYRQPFRTIRNVDGCQP